MRRSGLLVGLLATGCARAPRTRDRAAAATPGRAVTIVTVGDSLALGTGASSPRNGFVFRAYLEVLARRPGSVAESYAIGGSTADDVLRLQVPRLAHVRADAVIVCTGGNDVVHRIPAEAFAASYAALVARIRALQPRAAIVCCGVPDVGVSPLFTGDDHAAIEELSRGDDAAVRRIATRAGAGFADLHAAVARAGRDASRYLSEDRFHPSDAGYAALAAVLTPVLLQALDQAVPRG